MKESLKKRVANRLEPRNGAHLKQRIHDPVGEVGTGLGRVVQGYCSETACSTDRNGNGPEQLA